MNYSKENNAKQRKNAGSKKKKVRNKAVVVIFRILLSIAIIGCFAVAGIAFGAYMGIIENAPKLDEYYMVQSKSYNSIVYDQNGEEIDYFKGEENREYVSLDQIPLNMKNAIVAIEDERFYSHNGIDLRGMLRAVYTTVLKDNRQGASTITQQVIKNNIAKVQRNTLVTKLQEQYLAVKYEEQLEKQLGSKQKAKDYILEDYLNTIALNHGLNGVQTAAQYYFNKDVSELTLSECAVIAAITQRPTYYTPALHPENNKERQRVILRKMKELEFITEAEYQEALNDDVYARVSQYRNYADETNNVHDYYSDQLIEEIVNDLVEQKNYSRALALHKVYNGGLKIYTPQDKNMQKILTDTFLDDSFFPVSDYEIDVTYNISVMNTVTNTQEHYEETATVKNREAADAFVESIKDKYLTSNKELVAERPTYVIQPQAAMVIIDPHNGHVKAIVGGRGEKTTNRGFNRATQAKRQPGSVFKVLASYAPAVDLGKIGAGSVIMDEPFYNAKGEEWPKNWNGVYKGPVTAREGIYNSMNVATVRNMDNTGVDACFDYLLRFGFTTLVDGEARGGKVFTDRGLATALGGLTDGVTQLEVTAAYGTIANNGVYQKPTFYTKILDHEGQVLLEYKPEEERREVLKSTSAYILTDMMKDVLTRGTGGKARFKEVKMPIAGKTGTSTNTKDLTFVGYTPYYVAGIWMGWDKEKNINEDRGYHMLIWSHVMEEIHRNLEYKDFDKPNGITTATICLDSGKLAVPGLCDSDVRGSRTVTDIFAAGTAPTEYCDLHGSIEIDSLTGRLSDASTPSERRKTIIGIVKPDAEITNNDYEIPQSMIDGNKETRLNSNYTEEVPESNGDYIIDPETGLIIFPNGEGTENPDIDNPSPTFPTFPTFPNFNNNNNNNQNNNSTETPPDIPSNPSTELPEVPEYTAPPQNNSTEKPPENNNEQDNTLPIIE